MHDRSVQVVVTAVVVGVVVVIVRHAIAAGIPASSALTYSGTLYDPAGSPLTGDHPIQINLWDSVTPGTMPLCQTLAMNYGLDSGRFSVQLPDGCVSAIHSNSEISVEVVVDGVPLGRTKLGAVPYSVEAETATRAAGALAKQIVPAGAVMYFNLAECPSGWSDMAAAQGRYVVGLTPSGTLAGVAGTPLSDVENRPVGQHTHHVNDPGHAHKVIDPGHSHGVGAGTSYIFWNGSTCSGNVGYFPSGAGNCLDAASTDGQAATNVSVDKSLTGASVDPSGTIAGTNAPYVQLRVCQKD